MHRLWSHRYKRWRTCGRSNSCFKIRLACPLPLVTPIFYSGGQGKEHPSPSNPHPKNKTRAVYTEELTHLSNVKTVLEIRPRMTTLAIGQATPLRTQSRTNELLLSTCCRIVSK